MLRLVSFPRNSHVLRHLLSIKFADEGTAVTIALVCEQAIACLVTQRRTECNGGMRLQKAWHQCISFFPTIIQTRVAVDHKARVSAFILDKLEGFFALH